MLAREVLLRKCASRESPAVRVLVDVIAGAMHETAYRAKRNTRAAEAFLWDDGAMTAVCELIGLELHFVRFVADRVRGI